MIQTLKFRDSMERWMNGINAHGANTGLVNPTDYQVDLIVDQLDQSRTSNQILYMVTNNGNLKSC